MFMRLKVDKSHQHYFDEKRRNGVDFQVPVETENDAWPVGEIRFIRRPAVAPVLPYNILVCFNVMSADGKQLVERLGQGPQAWVDLGWLTALPESAKEAAEENAEAKPAETKPAEAAPAEAKPEAKPAEAPKPAEPAKSEAKPEKKKKP